MEDDNFDETLKKLGDQVSKFTGKSSGGGGKSFGLKGKAMLYLAVPVGLFVVLCVLKPSFVTEDMTKEDGNVVKKLNLKKVLLATCFLIALVGIMYFAWKYHKKEPIPV